MPYKYLYIDDVKDGNEVGVINGLNNGGYLQVDFMQPKEWDVMFNKEINENPNPDYLPQILSQYDGLILDLRLYDNANDAGYTATYRGSTVAQEIRTLVKERSILKDIPIVLITANENVDTSLDETGKNLFDTIVKRSNIGDYEKLRGKLISLANGYNYLNQQEKTIEKLLNYDRIDTVDFRFLQDFSEIKDQPPHVVARFLSKYILDKPSFLIDSFYLSSRLGVSIESEDWEKLKEIHLKGFKYNGPFSDFDERWWMNDIENWWDENFKDCYLRSLTSKERSNLINAKFSLKLAPIEKTVRSSSEKFWTVCKVTKAAIDNVDGFIIAGQDNNFPWQEKEYISKDEALRPTNKDLWKDIAMIDKDRLEKLKSLLAVTEQRIKK
jgi:CheY-like chemotaxis protein